MRHYQAFVLFAALCLGLVYYALDRPSAKPLLIEATPASMYACQLRPVRDMPAENRGRITKV